MTTLMLAMAIASSAQLVEDYRFKGKVTNTDGKPIDGARITLRNAASGKRIVIKVKKGKFDKRMIPHGVYEASFEADGYITQRQQLDWSVSGSETITRKAEIVLMSEGEKRRREQAQAREELGKRKGELYREAYDQLAAGKCDAATKSARELLGLGAGSFEAAVRFVVARCLAVGGSGQEAAAEYRKVIALKPDLFEGHFDLGNVLEQLGDDDGAIEHYRRAAELQAEHAETQYNIGALLFRKGDYANAKGWLERTIELDPAHAQAHKALAFVLLSTQDLAPAKKLLVRYLELAPNAPEPERKQIQEIIAGIR